MVATYGKCPSKTPAKTEMEAPGKRINIQRNQLSNCVETFESNCNTDEQAADQQAGLAVAVAITLKCIRKNVYHFLFFPFPTCNAIYGKEKELQTMIKAHFLYLYSVFLWITPVSLSILKQKLQRYCFKP